MSPSVSVHKTQKWEAALRAAFHFLGFGFLLIQVATAIPHLRSNLVIVGSQGEAPLRIFLFVHVENLDFQQCRN